MTVSTFTQSNYLTQSGSQYKANIDGAANVFKRIAGAFAPHQTGADVSPSGPDLSVVVDAGRVPSAGGIATEVAAQSTASLAAPSGNPRYDIVYIDTSTGAVGVATGAEAASPSDPSLPAGKTAVGRIRWTVGMGEITNADIDDLRTVLAPRPDNIAVSELADGTDGELITWDAAGAPTTVAVGTATHILTSNGPGLPPSFQAPAGGTNSVVQYARTVDTTELSTTSTSLVDTGISVSLTGVASGNAIRFSAWGVAGGIDSNQHPIFALYRNTTSLVPTGATEHTAATVLSHSASSWFADVEDTGHGGGSLTYRLYWKSGAGGTVWVGRAHDAAGTIQAPTTLMIEEIKP